MRRWLLPLLFGLLCAAVSAQVALIAVPRGLMVLAVDRIEKAGGINRMSHAPLATSASRTIVRPSPDLAYSSCPFDLSDGPVEIVARPLAAPYWSLAIFDSQTNAVFVRNAEQLHQRPVRIVLARAGQPTPAGTNVVRLSGARGIALIRILVDRRADFAPVDKARRTSTCGRLKTGG